MFYRNNQIKLMKKILFSVLLTALQTLLIAQNTENIFGAIKKEEIQMQSCTYDPTAEAVVLFDIADARFEDRSYAFEIVYERSSRIKIFNESGLKWATIEIPFYQKGRICEEIQELEAFTYNVEDGSLTRTSLNLKTCYVEKKNDYWSVKKFAMPNVKPGSIIEYRYKLRSQYLFEFRDWTFQAEIPVIYSRFSTRMIPFYQYVWQLQGAEKLDSYQEYDEGGLQSSKGKIKYKNIRAEFVMKNVLAFKVEEYLTTPDDYIIKLNFQLSKIIYTDGSFLDVISTWPELVKKFLYEPNFAGYIKKSESMASKTFNLDALSTKSATERFDTVINYVKSNYKCNIYDGKYTSQSVTDFTKEKQGNVADVNLFTIGLLNAVGINAKPVLLSTRNHGKIQTEYPFVDAFNYVVILADIDGKPVLTDATNVNCSNNRIPTKCINGSGLIIQKDLTEWVPLQPQTISKIRSTIGLNYENGNFKAKVQTSAFEYEAVALRDRFGNDTKVLKKHLERKGYQIEDDHIRITNASATKSPYNYSFETDYKPLIMSDKMFVSPFLAESLIENPLKQISRTYPVDMIYKLHNSFTSQIQIPFGYKIEKIPVNRNIDNDLFQMDYTVTQVNDKMMVSLNYLFKKTVYNSSEYENIKSFFAEIVNKGTEKFVFTKL